MSDPILGLRATALPLGQRRPKEAIAMVTRLAGKRGLAAVGAACLLALSFGGIGAAAPPPTADPSTRPVEPPNVDGVIFDATVTVIFTAGEDAFDVAAGAPLSDATVVVTATADGAEAGSWEAVTDADGVATLEGVARADTDGPEVALEVAATWSRTTWGEDGCLDVESFSAESVVSADMAIEVELAGMASTGESCPSPEPSLSPLAGVAWDASLQVTFTDADGVAVSGADVTLVASQGSPDGSGASEGGSFFKTSGTTGDDGSVTLADLPRSTEEPGAAAVSWWIEAVAFPSEDVDGCRRGRELRSEATIDDPTQEEQSVDLVAAAAEPEWGACDEPGDDAPIVTIVATGLPEASDEGGGASAEPGSTDAADGTVGGAVAGIVTAAAVTSEWVRVSQERADGATWESSEIELVDGGAEVRVQAWGTADEPSTLQVSVQGPYLRSGTEDGCTYDVVLAGETTVAAAFATEAPDRIEVALEETRIETGCEGSTPEPGTGTDGGNGAPAEGADDGAALTPPATDAIPPHRADAGPTDDPLAWLAWFAWAAGLATLWTASRRRRSRA